MIKICLTLFLTAIFFSTVNAATFTVTNLDNTGAGSLRQAITDANTTAGDDTINFQAGLNGTIQLSGELLINSNIIINGPGANILAVSGNLTNFRVFNIAANSTVNINNLTVTGGTPPGTSIADGGGGIFNAGTLTISSAKITGNRVGVNGSGIGILNIGTLNLINSTVADNTGNPTMVGPPILGGGIYNNGNLSITGSTISLNRARYGGGIYTAGGSVVIKNTTVYGNTTGAAGASGAGISNGGSSGSVTLINCTVAGNRASSSSAGTAGIIGSVSLQNTIVANNIRSDAAGNQPSDITGTVDSLGNNLISNSTGSSGWIITDLLNVPANLAPFDNYGGPTQTLALLPDSPAIDKGAATDLTTDQRGFSRPVDLPDVPNAPGGNGTDIGAYE